MHVHVVKGQTIQAPTNLYKTLLSNCRSESMVKGKTF